MKILITIILFTFTLSLASCGGYPNRDHPLSELASIVSGDSITIPPLSFPFRKFSCLDTTILEAQQKHKKVLLYFTGKFCIFARIMETKVFTDSSIQSVLSKDYVAYAIIIDNRSLEGKQNASFQLLQFNANSLPFFALLDERGNTIRTLSFTSDKSAFSDFIK